MSASELPRLNAALNALSTCLLVAGYIFIRAKNRRRHQLSMVSAFVTSILFLASYLVYHYEVGSVPFPGRGAVRAVYFAILITHIVLAAFIPPLALVSLSRALRQDFHRHVRIARVTLPLWLYVSVTGVVIYWMLYGL